MGQRRKGKRPLDQTPLIRLCASPRQPLVGTHESRMRRETEERHVEYGRDHREIRCKLVSHMPGKQKSLMMRRISQPSNPTHPPNNPFRCAQWAKHLCHGVSHLYKTTADTHHTRALIPPPCLSLLHTHTHTHTHTLNVPPHWQTRGRIARLAATIQSTANHRTPPHLLPLPLPRRHT